MSIAWQHRLGLLEEQPAWMQEVNGVTFSLPKNDLYINSAGGLRHDVLAAGPPASDPNEVARDLLDEWQIDRAILLGGPMSGLGALPNYDAAATVATAYNDWVCERWLASDSRYRAALVIAPQDPDLAAVEIDRVADRPGIVAVHVPVHSTLAGERHWYPIYAAAQRHALPLMVHPGATEAMYPRGPHMAGVPSYYLEWHTALTQPPQSNLISLVCHGVFERFPELKYVVVEGGFAWAADVLWRLDRDWKALRDEVPWVKRLPSEYVFDHVRFTTQPFIEPRRREHLEAMLDILECDRTLLFSSDYPHWDFDNPKRALAWVPESKRKKIFAENAIDTFGSRL
jgi:predicted TIM-barrel fold metal-dependent hydrolase